MLKAFIWQKNGHSGIESEAEKKVYENKITEISRCIHVFGHKMNQRTDGIRSEPACLVDKLNAIAENINKRR